MNHREFSNVPDSERLDSWKEIAAHLGRSTRTVQRWEKEEGLPVYRRMSPDGDEKQNRREVFAYVSEIDAWWRQFAGQPREAAEAPADTDEHPAPKYKHIAVVAAMVAVLVGVFIWQVERGESEAAAPFRPVLEKLRELPEPPADAHREQYALSPDGVLLAVSRWEDHSLWLESADGSSQAREIAQGVINVFWSPTGDRLLFAKATGDRQCVQRLYRVISAAYDEWPCEQGPINALAWHPLENKVLRRRDLPDKRVALDLVDLSTYESETLFEDRMWMSGWEFSPDGKRLAYSAERAGNKDIYVRNLPHGEAIRVTVHPGADVAPIWSPDGQEIAFFSDRTGGRIDVWRVPVGYLGPDSRATPAMGLGLSSVLGAERTPDGGISYHTSLPGGHVAVIPLHPATGAALGPELPDFSPGSTFGAWLNDGRTLSYDNGAVWVDRDMATGEEKAFAGAAKGYPFDVRLLVESGEDAPVAFWGAGRDGVVGFYALNEDRTEIRLIRADDQPVNPPVTLSPDGTEILFEEVAGRTPEWPDRPHAVYALRISDGRLREVARAGFRAFAHWSPDGQRIAYTDEGCLMVMPSQGGAAEQVICGPAARRGSPPRGEISWSPDGSKIAWTINHLERLALDIRVVDVATGAYHVLWTGDGQYRSWPQHIAWSPAGDYLAFNERMPQRTEVWKISNFWPVRSRLSD